MDFSFDSIGKIVGQGVDIFNSYSSTQTANDIARQQANMAQSTNDAKNTSLINNSKLLLVGGVILAIGGAFLLFNKKG